MATLGNEATAGALTLPRRRLALRVDPSLLLPLLIASVVAYLTLVPVVMLVWSSIQSSGAAGGLTLQNYVRVYSQTIARELLLTSFIFAVCSAVFGTAAGAVLAWFVERTNMPFRGVFFAGALAPLVIPGSLSTFAWVLLLSPNIGVINVVIRSLFGLEAVFSPYALGGMIWVEGLHLSPLAFLLIAGALRSMDANLEEAAFTSGASVLQTVRRVTVPLLLPAFASTLLLSFIRGLEAFEVPAMLGIPGKVYVFASYIFQALNQFPVDYSAVGTYAMSLLVLSTLGVLLYLRLIARGGFTTITGKAYRPRLMDLGRYRYAALAFCLVYTFLLIGLPLLILIWSSLLPFYAVPSVEALARVTLDNYPQALSDPVAIGAARNTILLGIGSATVTVFLTAVVSWITLRTRLPGRQLLDVLAFLPIAVPGLVLGVGLISQYSALPFGIYGSLLLVMLAHTTRFMPYGMRACSAAVVQIHSELEEAAQIAGANWLQTFRRVFLPLLRPGMFVAWVYVMIVSFRELSASIVLFGPNSMPLSVLIYQLYTNGKYNVVAAIGVMMIVVLSLMVIGFRRLGGAVSGE